MKKITTAAVLILFTLFSCGKSSSSSANPEGKNGNALSPLKLYVLSTSLSLRSRPSLRAAKLGLLRYGQTVRPFAAQDSEKRLSVSGIRGGWIKVKAAGRTGYVFSGFLSKFCAPSLYKKDLKAYAERFYKKSGSSSTKQESKNIVITSQPYTGGLTLKTQVMTLGTSKYTDYTLIFKGMRLTTGFLMARALMSTSGLGDYVMKAKYSGSLKKGRVEIWKTSQGVFAVKTSRGVEIRFMQQAD